METVETGKDKVKRICDTLRRQTLEPALEEAERIVAEAKKEAEEILRKGEEKAQKMALDAAKEIDKRRSVFETSMSQAASQVLETLKQKIKQHLFSEQLMKLLAAKINEPEVLAALIKALLAAIEKEGTHGDLSVFIPALVPPRTINELLGKQLLEKLKEKSVLIGSLKAGFEIKLHQEKITLSMTDEALKELFAGYIRKDLREFLFGV